MPGIFLFFSTFIFICGLYGLVSNTENLVFSLVSMELLLLSISLNFIYFSIFLHQPNGQIFSILLLSVAASEAALGLSLLLTSSKMKNSLKTVDFSLLRG
ncbi:NADH dehydrogenase subunit 4L (mitochondrion) [Paulinella micropora]|uniref:NADH dehydrogenase subunit 4L n=1 Tax=Paulinella micropora TaxID=1928728 RepID=A0A5K7VX89_9EUKA|nr:NADH dehydrogenase subunit 4L [Paulinella micropora]BBL86687.1 NADH dehydrogenase subunit 4L [Paulinella micropora]